MESHPESAVTVSDDGRPGVQVKTANRALNSEQVTRLALDWKVVANWLTRAAG
jgi:hypothetical protein